jgi:hypothetical protein
MGTFGSNSRAFTYSKKRESLYVRLSPLQFFATCQSLLASIGDLDCVTACNLFLAAVEGHGHPLFPVGSEVQKTGVGPEGH